MRNAAEKKRKKKKKRKGIERIQPGQNKKTHSTLYNSLA
jgi:hypothetical protein